MFRKMMLMISLLAVTPLMGAIEQPQEQPQVGRYQMTAITFEPGQGQLYLVDTTDGRVWQTDPLRDWTQRNIWIEHIEPVSTMSISSQSQ